MKKIEIFEEDKAWIEHREKFSEIYDKANYSSSLQSLVMRSSHKLIENAFDEKTFFKSVLEVGAGTGEHFPYIKHKYDHYVLTDLDPKPLEIAKSKLGSTNKDKVSFDVQPSEHLIYPDNVFDRVIATHVLEHIYYPHLAIKEWCRVLKNGGTLSILIPTDPGIAWRLGRRLGARKNAISHGIAYDYVMAREHVNACNNLVAILSHYFPSHKESWWPFKIASIDLNLFFAFHTTISKN